MCPSFYMRHICLQCQGFGLYPMSLHNRCKIDAPCIHLCVCSTYNVHAVLKFWLASIALHNGHQIDVSHVHIFICGTSSAEFGLLVVLRIGHNIDVISTFLCGTLVHRICFTSNVLAEFAYSILYPKRNISA